MVSVTFLKELQNIPRTMAAVIDILKVFQMGGSSFQVQFCYSFIFVIYLFFFFFFFFFFFLIFFYVCVCVCVCLSVF